MRQHLWKDKGLCVGLDTNLYFDLYEEDPSIRPIVDEMCTRCPVAKICFANGISGKEWGIWGGIYLQNGEISKEFNNHKTKKEWSYTWQILTMEK